MEEAIPDWLLIALGILADVAVLFGGYRLVTRLYRRRAEKRSVEAMQRQEAGRRL